MYQKKNKITNFKVYDTHKYRNESSNHLTSKNNDKKLRVSYTLNTITGMLTYQQKRNNKTIC